MYLLFLLVFIKNSLRLSDVSAKHFISPTIYPRSHFEQRVGEVFWIHPLIQNYLKTSTTLPLNFPSQFLFIVNNTFEPTSTSMFLFIDGEK